MKACKISRWGQRFWVKDCRELEPGIWAGVVNNDLGDQPPLTYGDTIAFVAQEIIDPEEGPKAN